MTKSYQLTLFAICCLIVAITARSYPAHNVHQRHNATYVQPAQNYHGTPPGRYNQTWSGPHQVQQHQYYPPSAPAQIPVYTPLTQPQQPVSNWYPRANITTYPTGNNSIGWGQKGWQQTQQFPGAPSYNINRF